ncbi:UNVERIFIED_CONTAM: hypothetical protein PYX00_002521 [Menopon gallinae]
MVTENLKHIIIRKIYGDGDKSVDTQRKEASTVYRQYVASSGPIIASMSSGMCAGFSAVLLPQLMAEDTDIVITKEEGSWIASMLALPLALGCLFSGHVMDILGRKLGQIACCVPFTVGSLVLAFAPNVPALYIGRFLTGFCVGLIAPIIQVFVAEVSEPKHRGILLSGAPLTVAIGILLSHVLGTFLDWRLTAGLCGVPPLICILILPFVPESPAWLLQRGRAEDAEKAFRYYRGNSVEALKELNNLLGKNDTPEEQAEKKLEETRKLKLMRKSSFLKPFLVLSFLFLVQQFSGVNAVAFYSVTLLKEVLTSINEYVATIIIDVVRFVSSVLAILMLKRYGRKSLTILSAVGTSISLFALAGYLAYFTYVTGDNLGELFNSTDITDMFLNETASTEADILQDVSPSVDIVSYLPLVFLISYICFVSIGLVPMPWVLAGEIFSKEMRGVGSGGTSSFGFLCFFVVVKTSPDLFELLGVYGTFCFFAVVSLVGSIVMALYLPETKDKTLAEIEAFYKRKSPGDVPRDDPS